MKSLIVEKKYNGYSLINYLLKNFDGLSKSTIYKALRKKDIIVNDVRVKENINLFENDKITIYIKDELLFKKVDIKKVFEDDNILVVFKPVDIEVVSSDNSTTLTSCLLEEYDYIEPCHRLDRNTKGLVLFAKNKDSLNILLNKFKNMEIEKYYKCRVYGILNKSSKTLEAYLFKDNKKSLVYISDVPKKGYVKIITSYNVLEIDKQNNTTILDIKLHTGRTHQIRAHLAHIGFPIIGDGKYGNYEVNKRFKKNVQELCAYKLHFDFKSDAGILNYLDNKTIEITD